VGDVHTAFTVSEDVALLQDLGQRVMAPEFQGNSGALALNISR